MKKIIYCICFLSLFSCTSIPRTNFSINFIIDKQYDEMMIFNMFRSNDPAGLLSRSQSMGIDYDFARKLNNTNDYSSIKMELDKLVNDKYQNVDKELKDSIQSYSLAWNPIIDNFSNVIEDITGYYWFYNKYVCVVSAFHPGISDWYGNRITRKYGEDPLMQRRITAHEIVLSHIFQIFHKDYANSQMDDNVFWKIAEITTVLILDDSRLLKYWNGYIPPKNYFSKSNYPQLASLEDKLRIEYSNRTSFRNYLTNAITIVRNGE